LVAASDARGIDSSRGHHALSAADTPERIFAAGRRTFTGDTNVADLTRTIRTYFASNSYENPGAVGARFVGFTTARKTQIGLSAGAYEINCQKQKILVAMTIKSDTKNSCGVSPGSISRNYEGVGDFSVYPYFGLFLQPALRGYRVQF
jgi:hypothetical protein